MRSTRPIVVLAAVITVNECVCARPYAGAIAPLYVDDDAPPGGDGATWDTAYRFLTDALANAGPYGEVRIAQGVYRPDESEANPQGTGLSIASFHLPFDGFVSGGYAGIGAPDPDARDIAEFETVLSGDLDEDDQPNFVNYEDNALVLLQGGRELQGCTLQSAHCVLPNDEHVDLFQCRITLNLTGISSETVEVSHCDFDGNRTGVIIQYPGDGDIEHCSFANHSGRAVVCGEAGASIKNCTFLDNTGGAGYVAAGGSMHFQNCDFIGNSAEFGATIYLSGHGAPASAHCSAVNCSFVENAALKGGAIYSTATSDTVNTPVFINCVFFKNAASESGAVLRSDWSKPTFVNCTIVDNHAPNGALHGTSNVKIKVFNSIVQGNTGGSFGGPGTRLVRHSNVAGIGELQAVHANPLIAQFLADHLAANVDVDPMFIDSGNGDFRLKPNSPCIDAGRKGYLPSYVTTDIHGVPRFRNDPSTPNTGQGTPPIDMGAHEFQP